ncbi:MAG: hypothetical protein FJ100_22740 [Deltaproteobacteria bacterium]|nr:hypothetical protein [Deltaproteobacteria bacterium]
MAQFWTDSSLSLALQADLTTPSTLAAGAFVPILGDTPKVAFNTPVNELELMVGQVGAAAERIVGARSGTLTFSVPLQGFKSGYDPTAENPGGAPAQVGGAEVIPPWFILLANAVGCNIEALAGATLADQNTNFWRGTFLSNSVYGAGKVTEAGTDSTNIQGDAGEGAAHKAGQFLAAAVSASVAPWVGFIKTKVVDLMTAFEAARAATANYDDNAANIYGTATAWQSDDQPRYLTAYWTGPNTKACYILSGLVCESFKISLDAAETPVIEFTFKFYDYSMDKTKGGLVAPDTYVRTPQIVGNKSGVLMFNTAVKCGLEAVSLEWKAQLRETKCHYAAQGISAVAIIKPRVTISFSIPHDADNDVVYSDAGVAGNTGSHYLQSSLELGTTHSLGIYLGPAVGKCLGVSLPASIVTQVPSIGDRDGLQAYTVTMEATSYSGDETDTAETSSNSPLDAICKFGLA